ncbi:MAG: acyl carrier protein [Actinomycetota bacterium]
MNTDELRDFILNELHWDGPPEALTDDYPLIGKRVLESLGISRMVGFLEDSYNIEIFDEELVTDHFGTLRDIAELVASKLNSSGPGIS